jgi:formamidopyrimidine-DNA glycosylase
MPELPEVETTVAGLRPFLVGQRIASLDLYRPDLRWPFPMDLRQRMTGARITALSRRAKYGLIHNDRDDVMIFHLGMSGRWRVNPETHDKHDHLVLTTDAGARLALNDPRRFGSVDVVEGNPEIAYPPFAAMGPEPLSDRFDAVYLRAVLKERKPAIKLALLDQRIVAGLGNIYVCEALHMARINPMRLAGDVKFPQIKLLVPAIKDVLAAAIEAGGSTLRDFRAPDGDLGYFAKDWQVYGREGAECSCGKLIRRIVQGGRSTFYCVCQR